MLGCNVDPIITCWKKTRKCYLFYIKEIVSDLFSNKRKIFFAPTENVTVLAHMQTCTIGWSHASARRRQDQGWAGACTLGPRASRAPNYTPTRVTWAPCFIPGRLACGTWALLFLQRRRRRDGDCVRALFEIWPQPSENIWILHEI
jgi:hypothetical protein